MTSDKILIVEDELLIAKGLSRKLKKLGYAVVGIVSSGEAALEKVAEFQPDLVFSPFDNLRIRLPDFLSAS